MFRFHAGLSSMGFTDDEHTPLWRMAEERMVGENLPFSHIAPNSDITPL
jgi:hypothetical protein